MANITCSLPHTFALDKIDNEFQLCKIKKNTAHPRSKGEGEPLLVGYVPNSTEEFTDYTPVIQREAYEYYNTPGAAHSNSHNKFLFTCNERRKILIKSGVVILLLIAIIAQHLLGEMGSLRSDSQSSRLYAGSKKPQAPYRRNRPSAKPCVMPMRSTRACPVTLPTADTASTTIWRRMPSDRWHSAERITSFAAATRRPVIRRLFTLYWEPAACGRLTP